MTRPYSYTSERDKRTLYDQQDGKCSVKKCRAPLHWEKPRNFIVEHENQLSISKDNNLANKTLRCKACAHRKTNGTKATSYGSDAHARAKLRHLRGENKPKPEYEWASRPLRSATRWPAKGSQKIASRGGKQKAQCNFGFLAVDRMSDAAIASAENVERGRSPVEKHDALLKAWRDSRDVMPIRPDIRSTVVEECARVADEHLSAPFGHPDPEYREAWHAGEKYARDEIAKAIRSLAKKTPPAL